MGGRGARSGTSGSAYDDVATHPRHDAWRRETGSGRGSACVNGQKRGLPQRGAVRLKRRQYKQTGLEWVGSSGSNGAGGDSPLPPRRAQPKPKVRVGYTPPHPILGAGVTLMELIKRTKLIGLINSTHRETKMKTARLI